MEYKEKFLKDFSEWVDQQVQLSEIAMKAAEKIAHEDKKIEAKGFKCKRFCYSKYASVGAESYENISILVKRIFSELIY